MRKIYLALAVALFVFILSTPPAPAQGAIRTGPDPATIRDPELEKDSLHNLEVARLYFKQRKAYVAALKRCEEIIAGNPTFAKMDEVLYMAGKSSQRLAENKGKQAAKDKTPEQLRADAREYFSQIISTYPQSEFFKQAEEELRLLGGNKVEKPESGKP